MNTLKVKSGGLGEALFPHNKYGINCSNGRGAVVNALAFSGTNYLFGKLGGAERKRHNLAMEKLSKARDEYSRERQQRLDFINQSFQQQRHAENLGAAMEEYARVTGRALPKLKNPPELADFYAPSEGRKNGEIAFVIGGMSLVAIIVYKVL